MLVRLVSLDAYSWGLGFRGLGVNLNILKVLAQGRASSRYHTGYLETRVDVESLVMNMLSEQSHTV